MIQQYSISCIVLLYLSSRVDTAIFRGVSEFLVSQENGKWLISYRYIYWDDFCNTCHRSFQWWPPEKEIVLGKLFFSHPPKKEDDDLCEWNLSGVCVHTLYFFYETSAWNHFILYIHISLGGVFNVCENGGGSMHPLKNYGGFCVIPLNAFNYITIWQTVL